MRQTIEQCMTPARAAELGAVLARGYRGITSQAEYDARRAELEAAEREWKGAMGRGTGAALGVTVEQRALPAIAEQHEAVLARGYAGVTNRDEHAARTRELEAARVALEKLRRPKRVEYRVTVDTNDPERATVSVAQLQQAGVPVSAERVAELRSLGLRGDFVGVTNHDEYRARRRALGRE